MKTGLNNRLSDIRRSDVFGEDFKTTRQASLAHNKSIQRFVTVSEESSIEWSNLIFLPFHPVFMMFVLFSVFIKATLGPLQAVYPIVYCNDAMDDDPFLIFVKHCYWYFCDSIYGIDTFLHIVHRQVIDKAMRREHPPKSAILLVLDLLSLIPFFRLLETNPCPRAQLWPNILAFNEFVVIYRVTDFFSLVSTHSYWKILIGYTIVLAMCLNCIACFWLLLTEQGFCDLCREVENFYDWRAFVMHKLNETNVEFATYIYGFVFVSSFALNETFDETKPSAILEYIMVCLFMIAGYLLTHFIVTPKAFAESVLSLRRICIKYPFVKKIIEETQRRNTSKKACDEINEYYKIIWRRRNGIVSVPQTLLHLPRYLSIDINQDILWPLFHHSPILRKSSHSFRRFITEKTLKTYKLPGEKFYASTESSTSLFYLKSGIVQLISADDGTSAILSITEGTVLGDINFLLPHVRRKVQVRCVTFCELFCVQRKTLIIGLHKYEEDRYQIMTAANERIEHAKLLFANKKIIRGLDRNEDEGIAWIKRRWWELFNIIQLWTKRSGKTKGQIRGDATREESIYHCSKHIRQLVLCTQTQLQTKSMFTNYKFPWILNPMSTFGYVWHRIISVLLLLVICLYPPNLIKSEIPHWFLFFTHFTDVLYIMDIGVSLLTAMKNQENVTFSTVMFERFKSFTFMLDLLSTIWFEDLAFMVGIAEIYYSLQFARLIKIYRLFYSDYLNWDARNDPLTVVCRNIFLVQFACYIITSHAIFELTFYVPKLTLNYFFGVGLCSKFIKKDCEPIDPVAGVTISWIFETLFHEFFPQTLYDVYLAVALSYIYFLMGMYCKGRFIAYMYLNLRHVTKYRNFVSSLKTFYEHNKLHNDLLKRLDRYFICHWKYYKGTDVLYPNTLEEEPEAVYNKCIGQVAEKIIIDSKMFTNADPWLIKDLAAAAKFLMLPRNINIFLFGNHCKNVIWVAKGYVKSEYHDADGNINTQYYEYGEILAIISILLNKASMTSFTTETDCEILYIPVNDFFRIYKQYETEYYYLEKCKTEALPIFNEIFKIHILKHKDHQQKLRDRLYSTRMSMISTSKVIADVQDKRTLLVEGRFWGNPECPFMQSWMLFRAVIGCMSIAAAAMIGGVGSAVRVKILLITGFCNSIAIIDVCVKLCLYYYNDIGILVTDRRKCFVNYLTKSFILDFIGLLPMPIVFKAILSREMDTDTAYLINTLSKYSHLYVLFAYFDYISDIPTVNYTFVMIIKWQIINILIVLGSSHYLMVYCVNFEFNDRWHLIDLTLRNGCWMPKFLRLPHKLDGHYLHRIFAQSLNLAESAMMRMNFGRFNIDRGNYGLGFVLFLLGISFWFITCYTLTLLVLNGRGKSTFQHNVQRLRRFLESERVPKHVINKGMDHFRYSWIRTEGINISDLSNDRVGVIFRQDINYYTYKKTFVILDTLMGGGEAIQKQLAGASELCHFLPGHDICRENDLCTTLCVVHRGKVTISRNGLNVVVLTKGDIFGSLRGTKLHIVRVTATATEHVDLLCIDYTKFQNIISDEVRKQIFHHPQSKHDYMATRDIYVENPYDTIQWLLRGKKTIQLPWSRQPTEAHRGNWYARWLWLTWFVDPFIAATIVLLFCTLPSTFELWFELYCFVYAMDVIHALHIILEFYTMELVVVGRKNVYRRLGLKQLKDWRLYVDSLTILIPLITLVTNDWRYQTARLFRLRCFFDFEQTFCKNFESKSTPIVLKMGILLLLLHSFTCGWIMFACRDDSLPITVLEMRHMNKTIDFSQWVHPDDRTGGCARATRDISFGDGTSGPSFVVPKYWRHDYVVAMTYILLIHTHTSMDTIIAVSLKQVYYKTLVTFFMYLLHIWIMSVAVNSAYTRYRELYLYDYGVNEMYTYLSDSGLCKSLLDGVLSYTRQLWKKQKGDWLPELAYQGPPCLRQDLFSELYIHHLHDAVSFRSTPDYFKRQLAARLKRIVIFPGQFIVREGDVSFTTYFVHEGEVEKWYNDSSGDAKLISVLYTNGYFGIVGGVFTDVIYQYSYYTRTVVDLVYLERDDWLDLKEAYPDVTATIYEAAAIYRKEYLGGH